MFAVSTKGDYGLLFLAGLAEAGRDRPFVSLREIAQRKRLPVHYLAQLAAVLKRSGFVQSREGIRGGYRLEKDPKQIRVGDVVRALERSVSLVRCLDDAGGEPCPIEDTCVLRPKWQTLETKLQRVMDEFTLADLIGKSPTKV